MFWDVVHVIERVHLLHYQFDVLQHVDYVHGSLPVVFVLKHTVVHVPDLQIQLEVHVAVLVHLQGSLLVVQVVGVLLILEVDAQSRPPEDVSWALVGRLKVLHLLALQLRDAAEEQVDKIGTYGRSTGSKPCPSKSCCSCPPRSTHNFRRRTAPSSLS